VQQFTGEAGLTIIKGISNYPLASFTYLIIKKVRGEKSRNLLTNCYLYYKLNMLKEVK
jgi:hypothetical protein